MDEELTLQNVCGGALGKAFSEIVPVLMSATKKGQKSSVAINITFKRPEDLDTMTTVEYSITPKFPAKKRKSLATITGDCHLKTEKVKEVEKPISLFETKKAEGESD